MKLLAIGAIAVGVLNASFIEFFTGTNRADVSEELIASEFNRFMAEYRKTYSSTEEYQMRLEIFAQNYRMTLESDVFGITKFSDRTPEELERNLGHWTKTQE